MFVSLHTRIYNFTRFSTAMHSGFPSPGPEPVQRALSGRVLVLGSSPGRLCGTELRVQALLVEAGFTGLQDLFWCCFPAGFKRNERSCQ